MSTTVDKPNTKPDHTTPASAPPLASVDTKSADNASEEMIIDTSKMNEGKRAALELAESSRDKLRRRDSFCAGLFMGDFDWEKMHPYPDQPEEDRRRAAPFLAELTRVLRDDTDPDEIDASGEVPDEVIDKLAKLGAFGIKVPEEYSGLGQSQTTYSRAAVALGSHCGNLTALLSAHQSIGVPQPLMMFGTEEQKRKFLPRVATGEISAFALTESGVGSDPARMATTADPTPDGKHFIINGEKLWCTNGTKAGVIVVMARTPSKEIKGRMRDQITAFIVEMDTPGVAVKRRCHFLGLRALYNGVLTFDNVKVPAENILAGEGRGLKVALTTLNTGRLTLPAACLGSSKRCLEICREWAAERVQWGAPIGHHAAIADKVARISANIFATEAMTFYTTSLVDRKEGDIRIEAAMCKMWGSERAWEDADETMQIRGGRGYETAASQRGRGEREVPIERIMRDTRINMIFEGSSEIMRLFIAREALDPHLRMGGAVLNPKLPMKMRLQSALKSAGFYAFWLPKMFLPTFPKLGSLHRKLRPRARKAAGTSRKLARTLFLQMMKFGPKLEREQIILGHLVDIGTELFAQSAAIARADMLLRERRPAEEVLPVVDYFCRESRRRIDAHFKAIKNNDNKRGYKLARDVLDHKLGWLESGIVK